MIALQFHLFSKERNTREVFHKGNLPIFERMSSVASTGTTLETGPQSSLKLWRAERISVSVGDFRNRPTTM